MPLGTQINQLNDRMLALEDRAAQAPKLSEGLAVIEERLKNIERILDKHIEDDRIVQKKTADTLVEIDHKLDNFLELRNKGMGILWVLSGMAAFVAIAYADIINGLRVFFRG